MSKLEVKEIVKSYGKKKVLCDISLCFETGHCYGLLGRNGMGKSTLINIIFQRCPRNNGKILIDGKKVDNNDALMSKMFCMNDSSVYPNSFRVKTVIDITASMYPRFDKDYAHSLCEKFGLDIKQRIGKLSTGYSTILRVILALSSNADFVFLDEPVLGIDVNLRELFYTELAKKTADGDVCFVISTHIIEEIQNLIDTVIILDGGKILLNEQTDVLVGSYINISGKSETVDAFAAGKSVIGFEAVGAYKSAVIMCDGAEIPAELTAEGVNLQKLFHFLTGGSPDKEKSQEV